VRSKSLLMPASLRVFGNLAAPCVQTEASARLAIPECAKRCYFQLEFDTGPIQTRTRAYEAGEGHAIEPGDWPYEPVIQLDDGWLATWDRRRDDSGPPYLLCPYHARGERVPRSFEVAMVGDVAVSFAAIIYGVRRCTVGG